MTLLVGNMALSSQSECESESEPQSTFVQWLLESPDFPSPPSSDIHTQTRQQERELIFETIAIDNGIFPASTKVQCL